MDGLNGLGGAPAPGGERSRSRERVIRRVQVTNSASPYGFGYQTSQQKAAARAAERAAAAAPISRGRGANVTRNFFGVQHRGNAIQAPLSMSVYTKKRMNQLLQEQCKGGFIEHINSVFRPAGSPPPDPITNDKGEKYYLWDFLLDTLPAHFTYHISGGKPSRSGALHIKSNDSTIVYRLIFYRREDNVIQFRYENTTLEMRDIPQGIIDAVKYIVSLINGKLESCNYTGETSASAPGGEALGGTGGPSTPSYKSGGTRKNRSRHKRQPKKRYTRRSK
jgi:hypothetical protein